MTQYTQHKDFMRALQRMSSQGGIRQKKANKVFEILGKASTKNPLKNYKITNHGESRIKNCVKYDLSDGYRLVTIQTDNFCMFCFCGDHDECDRWIDGHKGYTPIKDKHGQYDIVLLSQNIDSEDGRISLPSDFSQEKLYERLDKKHRDKLFSFIPNFLLVDLIEFNTLCTDEQIQKYASRVDDLNLRTVIFDILVALRAGDLNQAQKRIELYEGNIKAISDLSEEELIEIEDGLVIKKIRVGSQDYLDWIQKFMSSAGYQDWMLFMHSSQQKVVDANFDGSARLSGVSGSGKTCVVVNRSIRLAKEKTNKPILILTLNKSLAALLNDLLNQACPDSEVRNRIVSKSFFELCQSYLFQFEPENMKLYNDVTWKNNEHIDEVWREFYRCELHNKAAEVLLPIHKSLNSQGVNPEEYIRQEFCWIRSAFAENERSRYFEIERKGRAIKFQRHQREMILEGLQGWEQKMSDVGVIDYLGLSTKLYRHIDKLVADYEAILVDEAQDFGTIELKIIRKLVESCPNDIFLAGDMAQHVLPKHQSFKDAGINIPGARSLSIKRNYRNSREILKAAYEIFMFAMSGGDILVEGDIDILDPEYANFSSPKPLVLTAKSLEDEIAFALNQAKDDLRNNPDHKVCIAIAGFSQLEIKRFADQYALNVLDGTIGLQDKPLFLSDLEQTKGYEFDLVIILNCRNGVLPPYEMPQEEQFRDACRLYVPDGHLKIPHLWPGQNPPPLGSAERG